MRQRFCAASRPDEGFDTRWEVWIAWIAYDVFEMDDSRLVCRALLALLSLGLVV